MDYIIEFVQQGRFMKVSAVDPVSGTEAVIVGDARQSQVVLERQAMQKLAFLLAKDKK